jgi:glycosyltransferase involved in cell wall biosynthesis
MSELAILVPVLRRPHRVAPTIEAFERTAPGAHLYFVPDPDDDEEIAEINARGGRILLTHSGGYAEKVNRAVIACDEELIFLGADDLVPQPGWFEAALARLVSGVQVVGVNDEIPRSREHATHFLITRAYAELPILTGEPGPLCELYDHSCTDDELAATARHRGCYAYAAESRVTHLHPDIGTAPLDDVYRKGREKIREDRRLWRSRRTWYIERGQAVPVEVAQKSHIFDDVDKFETDRVHERASARGDLTVCVASYGGWEWRKLNERAAYSARDQAEVIQVHLDDGTLAEARNAALSRVQTPWVVFLDADDIIEPGYVAAMLAGTADVRAPMVRTVRAGRLGRLFMPQVWGHVHECTRDCLPAGNWVVVGAAARTDLVRAVGGFGEEAIYEDWALWLRCYKAGASFEPIHHAVYRQHLNPQSRNHAGEAWAEREEWHRRIVEDVLGAVSV